jgi:outer membrane lipase/esterase
LAQQGSFTFNNDLPGRLAALNLPAGTNVTVFDLGAVFNGLLNNAAALGFTNTTQEYLGLLLAGANPGNVSNFVFWDGIHPTTRAHQVFANALAEALNPEFVLGWSGAIGTAALTASDMSADALTSRLDLTRRWLGERGTHAYLMYNFKEGSRDWSGYQGEFDYDGSVILGGFDVAFAPSMVGGLALSKESVAVDFKGGGGSFKLSGESVSGYLQWRAPVLFADAVVHYGAYDVRSIGRATALGLSTAGETDGERWGAAVRLGGGFEADTYSFTPFVGLRYTRAEIDGYTEGGVSGLNFAHGEQTAKSVDGLIGVTADWRVPIETPVHLGLSAVYQKDLADDVRELSGRLGNTVAATSRVGVTDGLDESIKLGVRLYGEVSKRWGWTVGYTAEIRDDGDTASQYSVGVQTGF